MFKRIADLRIDRDMTQQEIADLLVCNRQVYARYERGVREIPVSRECANFSVKGKLQKE